MRIPLVGEPGMPGPQESFRPVSTTTFDQVGQAGAALGRAVEGVAEDLPVRIKQAVDLGTLAKAETQAGVHLQAFADSLNDGKNPQNNDPSTYVSRWNDAKSNFLDMLNQDPAVRDLHGPARIRFNTMVAQWSADSTQHVGHLATAKALANASGNVTTAYEMALMGNRPDDAKAVVQHAMDTGVFSPDQGKQMIFQIPIKSEYNQAVQMMSQSPDTGGGPIVLEEALQAQNADGSFKFYPHVIGQQRESLMFEAYRNARIVQAQTSEGYAADMAAGIKIDPNRALADLQRGKITRAQYAAIMKPTRTYDAGTYAKLISDISAYDPKADPTHEKEAELWGALTEGSPNLSPAAQEHLTSVFKEKLNPHASNPLNSATAKFGFNAIDTGLTKWVFGQYETKVPDPKNPYAPPKTVLNQKAYQDAMQRKAETTAAFISWLQDPKNANATPADATKFIYGYQQQGIRQHAAAILGDTGATPSSNDLDAILSKYGVK